MPEAAQEKLRPAPQPPEETFAPSPLPYAELEITTNFSFLRGASRPEELAAAASLLRLSAFGIADRNTLAGTVRVYRTFNDLPGHVWKPKLLTGARLCFADGTPDILAYPRDRESYGRLCRLLTIGNLRAEKGGCILKLDCSKWQAVDE